MDRKLTKDSSSDYKAIKWEILSCLTNKTSMNEYSRERIVNLFYSLMVKNYDYTYVDIENIISEIPPSSPSSSETISDSVRDYILGAADVISMIKQ